MGHIWPDGDATIPRVSSEFNLARRNPVTGIIQPHYGIDLIGFSVNRASAAGTVSFAQYNGGSGNEVRVKHDDGTETRYKHNKSFLVKAGDRVAKGQGLGVMGTTGQSTGIHLHFETRNTAGGSAVNPRLFMAARGDSATAGIDGTPIVIKQKGTTMFLLRILEGTVYLVTPNGSTPIANPSHLSLIQRMLTSFPNFDTFNSAERDIILGYITAASTAGSVGQTQLLTALSAIRFDAAPIIAAVTAAIHATGVTVDVTAIATAVEGALADEFGAVPEDILDALNSRLSS